MSIKLSINIYTVAGIKTCLNKDCMLSRPSDSLYEKKHDEYQLM